MYLIGYKNTLFFLLSQLKSVKAKSFIEVLIIMCLYPRSNPAYNVYDTEGWVYQIIGVHIY